MAEWTSTQSREPIVWDGEKREYTISLDGVVGTDIVVAWTPPYTYIVRIREVGGEWSPGFETPVRGCTFTGLKPDTEYEVELRAKNEYGEIEDARSTVRTKPNETTAGTLPRLQPPISVGEYTVNRQEGEASSSPA